MQDLIKMTDKAIFCLCVAELAFALRVVFSPRMRFMIFFNDNLYKNIVVPAILDIANGIELDKKSAFPDMTNDDLFKILPYQLQINVNETVKEYKKQNIKKTA